MRALRSPDASSRTGLEKMERLLRLLSGKDAFAFVSGLFSKSKDNLVKVDFEKEASHTAHHGYIIDNKEVVDEAVITVFKNPHSYTGEDVIEISIHGGLYNFRNISNLLNLPNSAGILRAIFNPIK